MAVNKQAAYYNTEPLHKLPREVGGVCESGWGTLYPKSKELEMSHTSSKGEGQESESLHLLAAGICVSASPLLPFSKNEAFILSVGALSPAFVEGPDFPR